MNNPLSTSERTSINMSQLFGVIGRDEIAAENSFLRYHARMDVFEKIRKIEALIASSKSDGERIAAELAKKRILERQQQEIAAKPIECKVCLDNPWKKKLLIALCNKYQIRTFRYKGQKYTTARFRAAPSFVDTLLWPEFKKYAELLEDLVEDIVTGLINQIHEVKEDETVIVGELTGSV